MHVQVYELLIQPCVIDFDEHLGGENEVGE